MDWVREFDFYGFIMLGSCSLFNSLCRRVSIGYNLGYRLDCKDSINDVMI